MFTRVVEITSKAGKARDLTHTVIEKVLSILKNQPDSWTNYPRLRRGSKSYSRHQFLEVKREC